MGGRVRAADGRVCSWEGRDLSGGDPGDSFKGRDHCGGDRDSCWYSQGCNRGGRNLSSGGWATAGAVGTAARAGGLQPGRKELRYGL
jgi:hypothetical protein